MFFLFPLILCGFILEDHFQDNFLKMAALPIEIQLQLAEQKMDEQISAIESKQSLDTVKTWMEARKCLGLTRLKYFDYLTNGKDEDIIQPPTADACASLTVLEHLWIAADAVNLIRTNLMISSQPVSAAQAERNQRLEEVITDIEQIIKQVESVEQWIVHWHYDLRIMISLPREYHRIRPLEKDLLRLTRNNAEGQVTGLFFIKEAVYPALDEPNALDRYRVKRIGEIKKQFPDMTLLQEEKTTLDRHFSFTSFAYLYSWESKPIRARVHLYSDGMAVYELTCVAPDGLFDNQNWGRTIDSFHKM